MSSGTIPNAISFLVDQKGRKTHAVLPLEDYEEIMSDLYGLAITISRRNEGSISVTEMKKRLREKQKVSR